MSNLPTLSQAELGFKVAVVKLPLPALVTGRHQQDTGLAIPVLEPPEVGDSLKLLPRREMALKEMLTHASNGQARLILPLPRRELHAGPLSIDLTQGHEMIIELEIKETRVVQEATRGVIEPPIPLPLGTSFCGIYLADDGSLVADIDNFIDINLSKWSKAIPQIPESLDEVLSLIFRERKKNDAPEEEEEEERESGVDWSKLRVEASGVTPRSLGPLELGRAGQLTLAKGTNIDVDYAQRSLGVHGRGVVEDASVGGRGFSLRGISGEGEFSWRLHDEHSMELHAKETTLSLTAGRLELPDGSHLELGRSLLQDVSLQFRTDDSGHEVSVVVENAQIEFIGGVLNVIVAGERTKVHLSPMRAEGRVALTKDGLELDVTIGDVELEVPSSALDLGIATLDISGLAFRGEGRLSGRSDRGYEFRGLVEAEGDISGSKLELEHLRATLAKESRIALTVSSLVMGREGIVMLSASGAARLRLRSGSVPLGPQSMVHFASGAEGVLRLDSVELDSSVGDWPRLKGGVTIKAVSEPISIRNFADLPRGEALLAAGVELDEQGLLSLHNLDVHLETAGR